MSDLADIAAAAGISIVDTPLSEDGDMGHCDNGKLLSVMPTVKPNGSGDTSFETEVKDLEALFSDRFTNEDPEYTKTVKESEIWSRPPCVEGYFGRRQRDHDNRRPWQQDRGYGDHRDGRGHRGRGDYYGNWNQHRDRSYDRNRERNNYQMRGGDYNRHRDRSPR